MPEPMIELRVRGPADKLGLIAKVMSDARWWNETRPWQPTRGPNAGLRGPDKKPRRYIIDGHDGEWHFLKIVTDAGGEITRYEMQGAFDKLGWSDSTMSKIAYRLVDKGQIETGGTRLRLSFKLKAKPQTARQRIWTLLRAGGRTDFAIKTQLATYGFSQREVTTILDDMIRAKEATKTFSPGGLANYRLTPEAFLAQDPPD